MLKQTLAISLFLLLFIGLVYSAPPTAVSLDVIGSTNYELDTLQFIKVTHSTDDVTDYTGASLECYAHIEDASEKVLYRLFNQNTRCVTESCESAESIDYELRMDANLTHSYDFILDSKIFETDTPYTIFVNCTDFEINETISDSLDFNAVSSSMAIETDLNCNANVNINNNLYCDAQLKDYTYSDKDSYCNAIYKESGEIRKVVNNIPYNKSGYLVIEDKIDLIFGELDYGHTYTLDVSCFDSTSKKLDLTQISFSVENLRPNDNFLVLPFLILDRSALLWQVPMFVLGIVIAGGCLLWITGRNGNRL